MRMRAILYSRVSTRDRGQNVENQLRQLREFCQRQDWDLVHEYIDHETGAKSNRSQLQAMMLAASQGKADVLLFWALDRLSREGAFETLRYLNLLTSYGVGFRSYSEPYLDSCGVFKEAVVSILATIAKQERIRTGERVKAGMARAREKGVRFGRPRHGADVRQIAHLRRSGASLRAIAKRVGNLGGLGQKIAQMARNASKGYPEISGFFDRFYAGSNRAAECVRRRSF